MDPLTITLGVASLLGCVAKVIKACNDLQIRYSLADDLLPSIAAECDLMRVGFSEIHQLLMSGHELYRNKSDLLDVLENTLAGCSLVLAILREEVGLSLHRGPGQPPKLSQCSKLQFVCNGTRLQELLSQLRGQQGGLSLILNIMQTKSIDTVLKLVQSNARQLARISGQAQSLRSTSKTEKIPVLDTGSIFKFSATSEKMMTNFDFEDEVKAAAPYRNLSPDVPGLPVAAVRKSRSKSPPKPSPLEKTNGENAAALNIPEKSKESPERVPTSKELPKLPIKSIGTKTSGPDTSTAEYSLSSFNLAISDDIFTAISTRNHAHLQVLIDSDVDLTIRNSLGHSALSEAAHQGDADACKMLLQGHAGPETQCRAKDCKQALPIHIAARLNSTALLQILLDHGAKIGGLAADRRNALHWAAEHDSPEAAIFLLNSGLDSAATDSHGDTPLHIAVTYRSNAFIKAYLEHEKVEAPKVFELTNTAEKTAMQLAVESGGVEGLTLLMDFGAKIDILDKHDATLLHHAARRSCHEAVRTLVSKGLHVDARDRSGHTPLHYAAMSEFDARRTIRVLLALGADLEARRHSRIELKRSGSDARLATPVTSRFPHEERPLKKRKELKRIEVFNGRTPLLVAALKAPASTVKCLIDEGACLDVTSACGCGALALSKRNTDTAVFGLLAKALLVATETEEGLLPLKLLHFAVASGEEFNLVWSLTLAEAGMPTLPHGVLPGSPAGVILRSSEGSCSYEDKSMSQVEAAIAACDDEEVSIHRRYLGLSAVERAVLCWQESPGDILELLLMHDTSAKALEAIERAQAQLRKQSRDKEGGVDPKDHEKYRVLGSRRNELVKLFGDATVRQVELRRIADEEREARERAEMHSRESEGPKSSDGVWAEGSDQTGGNSKRKATARPRRKHSDGRDPSSDALRIEAQPWLGAKSATGSKASGETEERWRKEWQLMFGFIPDEQTCQRAVEATKKTLAATEKSSVGRLAVCLASRMSALTAKVELMGTTGTMRVDNIEAHPSRAGSSLSI